MNWREKMDPWEVALLVGTAAGAALALAVVAWSLYSRFLVVAPPSRALVIFGRTSSRHEERDAFGRPARVGSAKFVVGGAAFVFPWTHSYATLSLGTMDMDVPVRATLLSTGTSTARVDLRIGAQVKISSDPEGLRAAAENLLGKSETELRNLVRSVIEGHVHSVLAHVSAYLLEAERERIATELEVLAATDLVANGLVVQSLGLKEIVQVPAAAPSTEGAASPATSSSGKDVERIMWEVSSRLRKLEAKIEDLDRRSRVPEIVSRVSELAAAAPRVADLR